MLLRQQRSIHSSSADEFYNMVAGGVGQEQHVREEGHCSARSVELTSCSMLSNGNEMSLPKTNT
jgi:hypothetical protein